MVLRRELVELMGREGANVSALCRGFGVGRNTAYKWLRRFREQGEAGLAEHSRRPRSSPGRTGSQGESAVLSLRDEHPAWGPRKLRRRLLDLGHDPVPSASTVGEILRRNGRIGPEASEAARRWLRFEHAAPNELWQGDFKGHFELADGKKTRCYPLTVLDDHSRYNLVLAACGDQTAATVKGHLSEAFSRYGLPAAMLLDNGAPWGCSHSPLARTALEVWLMRLGVLVLHGRPYHPQTQGKEERFHRTLKAEVLTGRSFDALARVQASFDPWRDVYNRQRPHEALGMETPAKRYRPSPRSFPQIPAEPSYGPDDAVRRVNDCGYLSFASDRYFLGEGFAGERVGLRPAGAGTYGVYYGRFEVGRLRQGEGRVESVRHGRDGDGPRARGEGQ